MVAVLGTVERAKVLICRELYSTGRLADGNCFGVWCRELDGKGKGVEKGMELGKDWSIGVGMGGVWGLFVTLRKIKA